MPVPLAQDEGCSPEDMKVMSAHCFGGEGDQWMCSGPQMVEKCSQQSRVSGGSTHVVQTTAMVAIGDDLHSAVGAFFNGDVFGSGDCLPAEVAGPLLKDGGPKGDVEGFAGLVADGEEDRDVVLGVAELHGQGDTV